MGARSGRGSRIAGMALLGLVATSAGALDLKAPPLSPLAEDGIHDPAVESIDALQEPARALDGLPTDRRGEVDWVRTLRSGLINPRKSIDDDPWEAYLMRPMDLDILMTDTAEMPHVLFPHDRHTEWLTCSNCHPAIFVPQRGANDINMTRVLQGEFCGRCHDKVAFSLWTCERCHSVPHSGSPAAWW